MSNKQMHVEMLPSLNRDGWHVLRARISGHPRWRKRNGILFFEVPEEFSDWLAIRDEPDDLHDAFLRALIFPAMEGGRELMIHGNVSTSLLENMEAFQEVVACWPSDKFRPVSLKAAVEVALPPKRRQRPQEALLAFSGGLDSTHTLYHHCKGLRGRRGRKISHSLFIQGFDVGLDDPRFDAALDRAEFIASNFGSQIIPLRTNLKGMFTRWRQTFSSGVAAALSLFERRYARGLIASSFTYRTPGDTGTLLAALPLLDPLMSSDSFKIVQDGADSSRVAKCEFLRESAVAAQNIRVCWQGEDMSGNCGACEKCIRQMLCMKAVGVDDLGAFQRPLTPEAILALSKPSGTKRAELEECYRVALANGRASMDVFRALRQLMVAGRPAAAKPSARQRVGRLLNRFRRAA